MDRGGGYGQDGEALIGLDERPRPASPRERVRRGLAQSAPFSSLQRRIILFNLAGLAFLVAGVLILNQFRSGLIDQRVAGLQTIAEVIALSTAETALDPTGRIDRQVAARTLTRVAVPTGLRVRLYGRDLDLLIDTRTLIAGQDAPPRRPRPEEPGVIKRFVLWLERYYPPPPRIELGRPGAPFSGAGSQELQAALDGRVFSAVRRNDRNEIIVAVAHPLSLGAVRTGALLLTTEGEDIMATVRAERVAIIQAFILAVVVSTGLSILLANTIARPIRHLAAAAASGARPTPAQSGGGERVEIPDLTARTDEIGDLSAALIRLTDALYARIEAIESFAADVAHEIKNPLTSLRSAVETMEYARTPEQRQRLLDVITNDVARMDRLVTDISNASRLDAEMVRERMERFDLSALCRGLSTMFADRAERQGVHVRLDLPQEPLMATGVEGRIAQVITNFLDNALSFSPEGGTVTLSARRLGEGLCIGVADEGPGVPEENRESVFDRFYTERPDAQAFGTHSGLGLAISRQIVEAHGGHIWVENRPGRHGPGGAHFLFELPG